jgi:hypothetical protein
MMATIYSVRVFCDTEEEYRYTEQTGTVDPAWIPPGCESHVIRDFVVEDEREE